ncbi:10057_t:CDS:2 [Acaulospora colombiana]|uniref:10057_t:CDS:1 n=1 Tax=Acaulospora colombiana TaxID=27376 RepID=A0ACA9NKN6_9GLOM|nr:10057_t:CDS:2 [Acaulospora colombiana]
MSLWDIRTLVVSICGRGRRVQVAKSLVTTCGEATLSLANPDSISVRRANHLSVVSHYFFRVRQHVTEPDHFSRTGTDLNLQPGNINGLATTLSEFEKNTQGIRRPKSVFEIMDGRPDLAKLNGSFRYLNDNCRRNVNKPITQN